MGQHCLSGCKEEDTLKSQREKRREDRKEQILSTALEIFGRYGYKKTTVEDIADELGMTKGNIYRYVENKQDLYEQTIANALQEWQRTSIEAVDMNSPVEAQFKAYALAGFDYLEEHKDLRSVLVKDPAIFPLSEKEDRFGKINRASMGMLQMSIQRGIDEGRFRALDAAVLTKLFFSVYVMFIIKNYIKSEDENSREMFELGLDVMFHGLLSPEN